MSSETKLETRTAKLPQNLNFLRPLGTYETGIFDEAAAEIPAYDPRSKRLFVVKATEAEVDVLDISNPKNPTLDFTIDVSPHGGGANSVAVNQRGVVAVAVEAEVKQQGGSVVFFNRNGNFLSKVNVGSALKLESFTGISQNLNTLKRNFFLVTSLTCFRLLPPCLPQKQLQDSQASTPPAPWDEFHPKHQHPRH